MVEGLSAYASVAYLVARSTGPFASPHHLAVLDKLPPQTSSIWAIKSTLLAEDMQPTGGWGIGHGSAGLFLHRKESDVLKRWCAIIGQHAQGQVSKQISWQLFLWRVPNPPGANLLVAERAPWRSSQFCVTEGQQPIGKSLQIPVIFFCTPGNPCATPIVTRGEGSFSYQGVSTRVMKWASS